jgi:glycosyltransferase involved in cell wall biosynthesis
MKVAVLHDYFTQLGGAERVAEELYRLSPDADLVSLVALAGKTPASLSHADIRTSWMQNLPGMEKYFRLYFLLYPLAVRSLDLSGYDLVLSSSSGYAKGVRTGRDTLHVCYCHTPMRWAWNFEEYSARERMGLGQKIILPAFIAMLRNWDEFASCQPDHLIANSQTVANRIARVYGRAAEVIHPPVDVDRFRPSKEQGDYYLILSRLVSYKRLDLAVQACTMLKRKLIVIGEGTCLRQLKELAGPTVHFVGRLPDSDVERVTGLFFDKQTPEDLAGCIERFESCEWSPLALRAHAGSFRREVFRDRMRRFLERAGCPLSNASDQINALTPAALGSGKAQICA